MIKLAKNFHLCRIEDDFSWRNDIDRSRNYVFRKGDYKLELSISLETVANLAYRYIPVQNFGYDISVEQWCSRTQSWEFKALSITNGKESKPYLPDQQARNLIRRMILRSVSRLLCSQKPVVIRRGPLTPYKATSDRYLEIDRQIRQHGYNRFDFAFENTLPIVQRTTGTGEVSLKDIEYFWLYSKDLDVSRFLKRASDRSQQSLCSE